MSNPIVEIGSVNALVMITEDAKMPEGAPPVLTFVPNRHSATVRPFDAVQDDTYTFGTPHRLITADQIPEIPVDPLHFPRSDMARLDDMEAGSVVNRFTSGRGYVNIVVSPGTEIKARNMWQPLAVLGTQLGAISVERVPTVQVFMPDDLGDGHIKIDDVGAAYAVTAGTRSVAISNADEADYLNRGEGTAPIDFRSVRFVDAWVKGQSVSVIDPIASRIFTNDSNQSSGTQLIDIRTTENPALVAVAGQGHERVNVRGPVDWLQVENVGPLMVAGDIDTADLFYTGSEWDLRAARFKGDVVLMIAEGIKVGRAWQALAAAHQEGKTIRSFNDYAEREREFVYAAVDLRFAATPTAKALGWDRHAAPQSDDPLEPPPDRGAQAQAQIFQFPSQRGEGLDKPGNTLAS